MNSVAKLELSHATIVTHHNAAQLDPLPALLVTYQPTNAAQLVLFLIQMSQACLPIDALTNASLHHTQRMNHPSKDVVMVLANNAALPMRISAQTLNIS